MCLAKKKKEKKGEWTTTIFTIDRIQDSLYFAHIIITFKTELPLNTKQQLPLPPFRTNLPSSPPCCVSRDGILQWDKEIKIPSNDAHSNHFSLLISEKVQMCLCVTDVCLIHYVLQRTQSATQACRLFPSRTTAAFRPQQGASAPARTRAQSLTIVCQPGWRWGW